MHTFSPAIIAPASTSRPTACRSPPLSSALTAPQQSLHHDAAPLNRHGGFALQNVPAIFPDIVAVRRCRVDGLTAVSYLHTRHSPLYVVPCLRQDALPCPVGAPHPPKAPWKRRVPFETRPCSDRVTVSCWSVIPTTCRTTGTAPLPIPSENPLVHFLRPVQGSRTLTDRRRLFP